MSYQFTQHADYSLTVYNDEAPGWSAKVEGWEWAAKAFNQLLTERDRLAVKAAELEARWPLDSEHC